MKPPKHQPNKTRYNNNGRWERILYLLPIPVFFIALCSGSYQIDVPSIIDTITTAVFGKTVFGTTIEDSIRTVLLNVRLPRVILSLLVGAALSASGAAFQSIMRNPLVEPYTLGVSSGAALGAAISMAFSLLPLQSSAFLFALTSIALCYLISRHHGEASVISLILAGIIISSVCSAALSTIQLFVDPLKLQGLIFWTMGGFYTTTWAKVISCVKFLIPGYALIFFLRWRLNILSLGDRESKMLGLNPTVEKAVVILAATLLASASVAVCGIISLVGLMIPHICRMLFGSDNQKLIPLSMSLGASYLTLVDTLARTLFTFEIPVGVFTTFLGAPFFIILLRKTRNAGWN